jgi:UDP-N-acetylmuramate: L-alanyl-gamma-D-glutamyl-meso-diaminopimelate ligase
MHIHFIAIGGSVMHNLALALAAGGHVVTGSDDEIHEPSKSRLAQAGILPQAIGWFPEKVHTGLDAVILGMHARADNSELKRAQELGLKIYSYPEFVFERSRNKQRIVVAGSHGKTTITSMIMHVLRGLNIAFDYVVGAQLAGFERTVSLTEDAPVIVIEGDEYMASPLDKRPKFLLYQPHVVVISGIAWDHINVFPTFEAYKDAFLQLLKALPKAGMVVFNSEDALVSELVWRHTDDELHYRYPYETPGYRIRDRHTEIKLDGKRGEVPVYGQHNMANAAAAHQVVKLLGVETEQFLVQMANFTGAGLRLQKVYEDGTLTIVRDFAHAPSKVAATVQAVAEFYKDANIVACLELHTYSSLNKAFLAQYRNTLKKLENKIVLISAHALALKRMEPISADELHQAFHDNAIEYVQTGGALLQAIQKRLRGKRDVILLMSSGALDGLAADQLPALLGKAKQV